MFGEVSLFKLLLSVDRLKFMWQLMLVLVPTDPNDYFGTSEAQSRSQ
jgi:hypothetical protein